MYVNFGKTTSCYNGGNTKRAPARNHARTEAHVHWPFWINVVSWWVCWRCVFVITTNLIYLANLQPDQPQNKKTPLFQTQRSSAPWTDNSNKWRNKISNVWTTHRFFITLPSNNLMIIIACSTKSQPVQDYMSKNIKQPKCERQWTVFFFQSNSDLINLITWFWLFHREKKIIKTVFSSRTGEQDTQSKKNHSIQISSPNTCFIPNRVWKMNKNINNK